MGRAFAGSATGCSLDDGGLNLPCFQGKTGAMIFGRHHYRSIPAGRIAFLFVAWGPVALMFPSAGLGAILRRPAATGTPRFRSRSPRDLRSVSRRPAGPVHAESARAFDPAAHRQRGPPLPPAGPSAGICASCQAVLSLTARYGKDLPVIGSGLNGEFFPIVPTKAAHSS